MMKKYILLSTLTGIVFFCGNLQAQNEVEMRLREVLRNTTLQLRAAQNDLAITRAENEVLASEKEELEKRIASVIRQNAAEQATANANIANLNAQLSAKDAEGARLAESVRKWRNAYEQASEIARGKEQERVKASSETSILRRETEQLKSQNRELYRIGIEILNRYEDFGLGRAIQAREPFTGLARVKLENLVQDYRDELSGHRIGTEFQAREGENTKTANDEEDT